MTCIAWRNGIMSCDSCWEHNGTQVVSAIKIHRLASGALLGSAGDNDNRAIIELLDKIRDPKKLPSRGALAETKISFMGLIAFPKGGVWAVASGPTDATGWPGRYDGDEEENGIWPLGTMGGYCAVGSGGDYALAAMDGHHSVSAAKAVEVACRRNLNCRPPVWTCKLSPPDSKPKVVFR